MDSHDPKVPRTKLSTAFVLPAEITDIVVDHLYNDPTTLFALSLVSRQWLWCSRYHLFYSIRLRSKEENYSEYLEKFTAFVKERPDVATRIREVTLGRKPLPSNSQPVIRLTWILYFIPLLPSLRTLIIHSSELHSSEILTASLPPRPILRKLVLSRTWADLETYCHFLSCIQIQHSLELLHATMIQHPLELLHVAMMPSRNPHVPNTSLPPTLLSHTIPSVQSLTVELDSFVNASSLALCKAIFAHSHSLISLDCGPVFDFDIYFHDLFDYLRDNGRTLLFLRLDLCSPVIPEEDKGKWNNLNLVKHCPALQTLHLTFFVNSKSRASPSDVAQWPHITSILSRAPTSLLRCKFGLFSISLVGLPYSSDWEKLDSVVSPLDALDFVLFQNEARILDGMPMRKHVHPISFEWQRFIKANLPLTCAAGLLRFS